MAFLLHTGPEAALLQGLILDPDEAARQRAERLWRRLPPTPPRRGRGR
jgi:hypothetical protein